MQPNLRYVGVVTLTLLSLLGFGMAYADKNQVSTNAKLRYDSGEKEKLVLNQQQLLDKFNEFINSPSVKSQVEQISRTARRQNLELSNQSWESTGCFRWIAFCNARSRKSSSCGS
ncbi:TPR repeat-containing protein [Nostoc commune NIES-4072]|uniref:TPR repeat-containing protein n=1 Tax=Nostoc commune NIES-4072 TaxID=2005467 RepID=A0A2R5FS55_NOSCO|nr:hypothetical protein [Nostoc commune]BBD69964.1 TPR repeat-containing protein [Nostoc commune HK-02]GBG19033.1 TPR repeat-containing protein [Nostoc commune NIES-4072]